MKLLVVFASLALAGCTSTSTMATAAKPNCTPDVTRREVYVGRDAPPLTLQTPSGPLDKVIERKSQACL